MSGAGKQTFATTVRSAVAIICHLWTQINALQDAVTEYLPEALKGLGLHVEECDDEFEQDEEESVCTAGMWSYELKRSGRQDGKGRRRTVGKIYMWVRLVPVIGAEPSAFVPFLGVHVSNDSLNEALELSDLAGPDDKKVGADSCRPLPNHLRFTDQDIAGYEWKDEEGHYGAAVYMPLNAVNSENIRSVLIQRTKGLVGYCVENWDQG